jgi:Protein of unknown function (DUF2934)
VTAKNRGKVDLELHARPPQHQADETSVCRTPTHEEIRWRAYEIYLERGGLPGGETDDWLRAERELQKVALFERDWNRVQHRIAPTPKTEIDIRSMEAKEGGNQR